MRSHSSAGGAVPGEGDIRVVVDPHDDPRLSDELHRRTGLLAGVVIVTPVPGVSTPSQLGIDLLMALGKDLQALRRECSLGRSWGWAQLWLCAEHVRHLVVLDADRLPPALCTLLGALAAEVRLHLWLVVRTSLISEPLAVLGRRRRWTVRQLLRHLPRLAHHADEVNLDGLRLPEDDFLTFRAACRERLGPGEFAQVDAAYRDAFRTTQESCRGAGWDHDRQAVIRQVRVATLPSRSEPETLIRLRAAQAAHFLDGKLVDVVGVPWPAPVDVPPIGLSRQTAVRLRRVAEPAVACALVLAGIASLQVKRLVSLMVANLSTDGRELVLDGGRFDIPAHAAGLVRAQLLLCRIVGAGRDSPLFVRDDGLPYSATTLSRRVFMGFDVGSVWWPDFRPWPLWHDHPGGGHRIEVSRVTPTSVSEPVSSAAQREKAIAT
jgi:hypothetical protein